MHSGFFSLKSGFTLIEAVIVILAIAILAVAVVPKMLSTTEISAIMAAEMAASDIRAVQSAAMHEGDPRTISFNGNSYTAEGLIPEERTLPGDAEAGAYTITFNSFGEPDQGGNFNISCGVEERTIYISARTGHVTIN